MYLGVSTLNLDAKGRLAIPARYRETLAGECASRVVLTINPSKTDRCLLLFPENEWLSVARKLAGLPFTDEKGQALKRLLLGHAAELELDAQGRIRVSPELREFAGLGKQVSLFGQVNKFEIWNADGIEDDRERWMEVAESKDVEVSDQLKEFTL